MIEESLESAIPPAASAESLRMVANFMCLWRLCDQARCRRARACRGAPRACITRLAPLVPEEARALIAGMYALKAEGAPFEEVELELSEERLAFEDWLRVLAAATGRPPRGHSEREEKAHRQ